MSALKWVERLLEPSVDETQLIEAAQVFLPSHYSDVVDERNICHLCGYPMCGNPLDEQLKQTYHISLAQKKVFDLTERKKFCSAECYRTSNYYASQLSSLPRDKHPVTIKFLSSTGRTVDRGTSNTMSVSVEPCGASLQENTQLIGEIKELTEDYSTVQETTNKMDALELKDDDDIDHVTSHSILEPPKLSSVGHLLHAMSSWYTPSTQQLLTSVKLKPQSLGDNVQRKINKDITTDQSTVSDTDHLGLVDERLKQEDGSSVEGAEYKTSISNTAEGEDADNNIVLPPVHSSAHSHLQMTIFIQQLKRNLPSITAGLSLDLDEVLPSIMPLVWTFRFSRNTVMFKPAEWKIIVLVFLRIIDPDRGETVLHLPIIQDWMKKINMTIADFKLMLNIFNSH